MSKLLNDFLFDVPDVIGPNAKIVISKELVSEKLNDLVTNKDLSQNLQAAIRGQLADLPVRLTTRAPTAKIKGLAALLEC